MHAIPLLPIALAALAAVASARAADAPPAEPDDAAALQLADKPAPAPVAHRAWRLFLEGAGGRNGWRDGIAPTTSSRGALDFRYDDTIATGLRAVLSDRLDTVRNGAPARERNVNSLREAYLSWHRAGDLVLDAGRVNIRHGAAWGYNPTDYFRGNALRAVVSPDPASLRENRMGTVVLQAQKLWATSALSAAVSPRLQRRASDSTGSLDLGATNDRTRWLISGSHKFGERFNPELLLHGGVDTPTQLGLNASALVTDAAVAFVEASVGRDRTLRAQALGTAEAKRMQRRAAAGLTYTTPFNLSLTAEADYSSAAPDRAQWNALSPTDRLRLLDTAQNLLELPARRGAFLYATWKDLLVRRLDLSGFVRWEAATHSRSQWLETRYHWDRMDLALQWQVNSGRVDSVFGSVPQARAVELSLRLFL
ncbi:MAG: hypothetical protein ACJ8G7_00755 [Rhizobacter sp.]